MPRQFCIVKNCLSHSSDLKYFNFPPKAQLQKKWIAFTGEESLLKLRKISCRRNKTVCELHFEESAFTDPSHITLKPFAVPTLRGPTVPVVIPEEEIYEEEDSYNEEEIDPLAITDNTEWYENSEVIRHQDQRRNKLEKKSKKSCTFQDATTVGLVVEVSDSNGSSDSESNYFLANAKEISQFYNSKVATPKCQFKKLPLSGIESLNVLETASTSDVPGGVNDLSEACEENLNPENSPMQSIQLNKSTPITSKISSTGSNISSSRDSFTCGECNKTFYSLDEFLFHKLTQEEFKMIFKPVTKVPGLWLPKLTKKRPLESESEDSDKEEDEENWDLNDVAVREVQRRINSPYNCTECSSSFTTKSYLIVHYYRTHQKPKLPEPTPDTSA